ncbi:hypothetical protein IFM89_037846 [Coptis chinensis]|uniref:Uncharacterized protein n=1 Tax=Coptis chinensis TaxID=261450 RepID=A0A835LQJ2_9MAGN|nr:hypothetical protein IFM89_037846 [Coptis chinensis]
MGNILFLSGVMMTIGLKSTMQFFMKRQNYKGTISFGIGFFLVLIGWPIMGMILEAYGFIVLFSGFWPTLVVFLQRMPIVGWIFQQPFVTSVQRQKGSCVMNSIETEKISWTTPSLMAKSMVREMYGIRRILVHSFCKLATGNVAGDSPKCQDLVLGHGALILLFAQLNEHAKLSILRNATWTLSNFCHSLRSNRQSLHSLLLSDEEVLTDACWALSYLSDGTNDKILGLLSSCCYNQLSSASLPVELVNK